MQFVTVLNKWRIPKQKNLRNIFLQYDVLLPEANGNIVKLKCVTNWLSW